MKQKKEKKKRKNYGMKNVFFCASANCFEPTKCAIDVKVSASCLKRNTFFLEHLCV